MITIKMGKTYDGMEWDEAIRVATSLKAMGLTDEEINRILEKAEDEVEE